MDIVNTPIRTKILQRRDTESNWNQVNPNLSAGEIVFSETSSGVFMKYGTGQTYNNTPFWQTTSIDGSPVSAFNLRHMSQADYDALVVSGLIDPNTLYIVSSDAIDARGEQIKNLANASEISDAVNLGQMEEYVQEQMSDLPLSDYVPVTRKINGNELTTDLNVGTITGINMNGASKGTSGVVDLGTVLTAHQSLTGYVQKTTKVAGHELSNDVTAADISAAIGLSNITQCISNLSGGVVYLSGDQTATGKKTFSDAFTVGTRKSGIVGTKSLTFGLDNLATSDGSFAGGQNCVAGNAYAFAQGYATSALGYVSHAEGQETLVKSGAYCAHTEGYQTVAINGYAHAEGFQTSADYSAHAEGINSIAKMYSHAEGINTSAFGEISHVEGEQNITQNEVEHAQGRNNVSNKSSDTFGDAGNTLDSVGIGGGVSRRNATEVMQNGDAYFLSVGGYDGTNAASAASKPLAAVLSAVKSYDETKANLSADGYAISADVTLNARTELGGFVTSPATFVDGEGTPMEETVTAAIPFWSDDGSDGPGWYVYNQGYGENEFLDSDPDATVLTWSTTMVDEHSFVAHRQINTLPGYVLGTQTGKPLATAEQGMKADNALQLSGGVLSGPLTINAETAVVQVGDGISTAAILSSTSLMLIRPGTGVVPVTYYQLDFPQKSGTLALSGDIPAVDANLSVQNAAADAKAVGDALRYSLVQPEPMVIGAMMAVVVQDRAVNLVQVQSGVSTLAVTIPQGPSGKSRDLFLRIEVPSGVTDLHVSISVGGGVTPTLENADGEIPALEENSTVIMYLAETKLNTFLVKSEAVVAVS